MLSFRNVMIEHMKIYKKLKNLKKILVLRANDLGDFIFSLPAFTALKENYPEAEIYLLGKKWHEEFLKNRKSPIDKVIVIPKIRGVGQTLNITENKKEIENFFLKMEKEKFDLAVQIHGGGKYSNTFIKKIKAKLTIGLKTEEAENLNLTIPYIFYQHEVLRYLEVVSLVGATTSHIVPKINVTEKDLNEAKKMIKKIKKKFIILHPGARDARRRWDIKNFAYVANKLLLRNFQIIITGVKEEKNIIEVLKKNIKTPVLDLSGKLSLNGLTGLLSLSSLVISNDTGPAHLAEAVGAKTITIFWGPNLVNWPPLTRENQRPLASWKIICPKCGQNCAVGYPFDKRNDNCLHDVSFVNEVSVKEVMKNALELLETS